ncbi:YqaA family protein [Sulfurimonas autotrophica]|uniref:SNARE associated Golgi protein-related protein n=1 Tax=Sulfurimonas autotrophica (strain ATCC BAA-671 / DSM 16294 / JCM 11897 / OK10) TaxID=563040 RepID=E0UPQ0_SULAO|nr:YqaA family protein [Sulfurimonas autotrophica]ADN08642.1 SNARE associated Golgi protein-related protein [Sulfurimonas autotrophica DSM 16294]
MVYLTLFLSSFAAATFLPVVSEAVLAYDITAGYNIYALLGAATIGNTLGSCVNYFLGRKGLDYLERKKYVKMTSFKKAETMFDRYGAVVLLLSWAPVIGDPITFVAGVLHYDFKRFFLLVLFAKGIRYIAFALFFI